MSIANKLAKPVTEIIEHIAQKVPSALGHGHHRIAAHVEQAAEHFDRVEQDLADRAHRHHGTPSHTPHAGGVPTSGGRMSGAADGEHTAGNAVRTAEESAASTARQGAHDPALTGRPMNGRCQGGDPVDMVSGEMLMDQTDIALPGLLPLVLRRTHVSSYRCGRFFGPSWASTLDERLEADEHGLVLVTEDGMLLTYPVPRAGRPVYPTHGPRRPLEWDGTPHGSIRITDPATGHTRLFQPPADSAAGEAPFLLPLASITDRNGHCVTFRRTADGTPTEVRHSGGYRLAVDTEGRRVTAIRLVNGHDAPQGMTVRRFVYNSHGDLSGIIDSSGLPFTLDYDADHRVTRWTDRTGSWYAYTYEPGTDRVISGTGPEGILSARFTYDVGRRMTALTDSLGHTTTYHYDANYLLTRRVDARAANVLLEYDRLGNPLAITDELGRASRYTTDANGDPVRVERPDGTAVSARYDDMRLPTEMTAADGALWRSAYDSHGNRTEVKDPAGATTRFAYDAHGHLVAITDALGHTTTVRCNAAGLVTESADPAGGQTRYEFDAFGRTTSVTDPLGNVTSTTWTVEGRLLSRTAADGTTESWTYDAEGRPQTYTDPMGAVTESVYGHFGRLSSRTEADGTRTSYAHDTELRLVRVTGPGQQTWAYSYDEVGRVTAETDYDGRTVVYAYDAAGHLTSCTNGAGQTVSYGYDAVDNLVRKEAGSGVTVYGYDAVGRLVHASGGGVELTRRHDPLGRLAEETVDGSTLRLAYDELGRRTHRGTPSGAQTAWEYDAAGNVIGADLSGHVMGFRRDLLGREVGRALAPGLAMTSAWDCVHRLVGRTISRTGAVSGAETLVQQRAFGYRQDGNLTRATDHGFGVRDVEVDVMGRVRAVRGLDWNESYDYDGTGRLTSATWPAGEAAEAQGPRTYQGARVSTAGRYRYTYDAQGRTTVRRRTTLSGRTEVWHFTWDAEDRLTDLTTPDGTRWEYRYDPIGRRVAKSRIDDTTGRAAELVRFVWDGPVLAEQAASYADTSVSKTLTWDYQGLYPIAQTECLRSGGPGRRAQGEVDRRFFAVVTDLVGAPTELVAMDGAVAWRSSGTVWGRQAGADGGAGTSGTPLRFPGQYADGESGLHYNHLRYYDPDTATYLTPDPLGLEPSANPYGYVDNPHIGIDPFGLAATYNPVFRNRKEAFTHAKDMAGIPRSAQPVRQWTVGDDPARASYRNYVYKPVNPAIKSPDYNPRGGWGRYYQYETPQGIRVVAEHTADVDAPHPHFHAGMPKDEAITDMTGETYRELQPKHHLYYPAGGCGGG